MPTEHKVKSGDTLSAIAKKYKVKDWNTIWEADENKQLVKKRKDPSKLQPGDVLVIPDSGGAGKKEAKPKGKVSGGQTEADAVKKVDKHVEPKECFIWFMDNKRGYEPIGGTGCAHYCSHKKGWKSGKAGSNGCNLGYLIRVKDLDAKCKKTVEPKDVKKGHLWINDKIDHCGLVTKVAKGKGDEPTIEIEHCSSGQGKVAKNDWKKHFKGGGTFREA